MKVTDTINMQILLDQCIYLEIQSCICGWGNYHCCCFGAKTKSHPPCGLLTSMKNNYRGVLTPVKKYIFLPETCLDWSYFS